MNQPELQDNHLRSRLLKSARKLFYWTGAWVVTTAVLAFGPKFLWNEELAMTLLAVVINIGAGVGMIFANKNYLRNQDELQQKVQMDAMAITLGVTLIVSLPYSPLRAYDVVTFDAGAAHLCVLMSLTYLTSVILGLRRYR